MPPLAGARHADATLLEHYARHADGSWRLTTWASHDLDVPFPALEIAVALRGVYAKVDLLPDDETTTPLPPRPKVLSD